MHEVGPAANMHCLIVCLASPPNQAPCFFALARYSTHASRVVDDGAGVFFCSVGEDFFFSSTVNLSTRSSSGVAMG